MQPDLQNNNTYSAILASALHVFSRKGYVESKVEDIAREAGVNTATVYRHFNDKKSLFLAVVNAYGPLDEGAFRLDCRLSYTDAAADLFTLGVEYFKIIHDHIDILQIFMGESCYISKIKDQAWHIPPALVAHFSEYLSRLNTKNRASKKSRRLLAELFLSDIISYAVARTSKNGRVAPADTLTDDFENHMRRQIPCMLVILKRSRFI